MKERFYQFWQSDPRLYQMTVQSLLLGYGIGWLHFDVDLLKIVVTVTTALIVQSLCTYFFKLPQFDPRSAINSSLSLCLLLRTHSLVLMSLAAAITILSKFTLRWHHKHIFNPSNFGIIIMLLLFDDYAWISAGQWGNTAFFGFLLACLGGLVIHRANRSDVTYSFLLFYIAIVFGRAIWLGDPWRIPIHQLESGTLILFSFFMISDPKTTPNSRIGRIFFAFLVALGAAYVQFVLYRYNGLLWSLVLFSLFVPLIDWLLPDKPYQWKMSNFANLPPIRSFI